MKIHFVTSIKIVVQTDPIPGVEVSAVSMIYFRKRKHIVVRHLLHHLDTKNHDIND